MDESRRRRLRKLMLIAPLAIAGMALFVAIGGQIVLHLWNWLLPPLFGWREVDFWQALGLLALCRILFGGFSPGHRGGSRFSHRFSERLSERMDERMDQRLDERLERMSPEARERFRQRMRERWGFEPSAGESKGPE